MRSISESWSPSSRGDVGEVVERGGEAKDAVVFATVRGVIGAVHPEIRRSTFAEEEDLHVPTIYRVKYDLIGGASLDSGLWRRRDS
jgi:hypothetical protein